MLTAFLTALLLAPATDAPVITPEQAKDHLGEEVVVQGQVTQVGVFEHSPILFLNFGGHHPDHVFSALIIERNQPSFPDARSWAGKTILVRGQVRLYVGKPGIALERSDQVMVDTSTAEQQPDATQSSVSKAVDNAVDNVPRRLERNAQLGLPTGTGQNMGGLYFDPQGADFTAWINHFKNEVYRNWIMPQAALRGAARGQVDFEFNVERDGKMSELRLLKSSGTAALDKAAQFALTSSHWLPLPDDYGPPRVKMQLAFHYNEVPQGQ